ncbi:MAG TPA: hypothetical protein VNZ86_09570, partial [Bacteroidia bacterium]|nr:hypothetical protein [Bacteroidia bacterium]
QPNRFTIDQNGNILIGTNGNANTINDLATLDIRGSNTGAGTLPTASISAQSSFAGLVVDQSGNGDIFTASNAGSTKFIITRDGRVGIDGATNLTANANSYGLQLGNNGDTGAIQPLAIANLQYSSQFGSATYVGNWNNSGFWGIGQATGSNSDNTLTIGNINSGNTWSNTQNIRLLLGGPGSSGAGANAALDVRSNLGTLPAASISGRTSFATAIVDQSGNGDIFTASKSGATKFTVQNSGVVVIGSNTNGIVFDPTLLTNPSGQVYFGSARPTKQIVLSPEYAGAVLTASNSASTVGFMTSDASPSASSSTYNFENYYQWVSTDTSLDDYTVAVRVTLPKDFSAWPTSNAVQVDYNTNIKDKTSNKLDVLIYVPSVSSSTPQVYDQANFSATDKTWATESYTGAQVTNWSQTNPTAVIYLKMYSKNGLYTQVGDIKLNYLSAF